MTKREEESARDESAEGGWRGGGAEGGEVEGEGISVACAQLPVLQGERVSPSPRHRTARATCSPRRPFASGVPLVIGYSNRRQISCRSSRGQQTCRSADERTVRDLEASSRIPRTSVSHCRGLPPSLGYSIVLIVRSVSLSFSEAVPKSSRRSEAPSQERRTFVKRVQRASENLQEATRDQLNAASSLWLPTCQTTTRAKTHSALSFVLLTAPWLIDWNC